MLHSVEPFRPADAEIVEDLWVAWLARDKPRILSMVSDDIRYELNVPNHVLPFGGVSVGKAAFSDRLQSMIEQIEVLRYSGEVIGLCRKGNIKGQVSYHCRHRLTGHESTGTMRQIFKIENKLITSIEAYKDVAAIQALMAMVSHAAKDHYDD